MHRRARLLQLASLTALSLLLATVAPRSAGAEADHDASFPFAQVETFFVTEPRRALPGAANRVSDLDADRVVAAVRSSLQEKQLRLASRSTADVLVHLSFDVDVDTVTVGTLRRRGPRRVHRVRDRDALIRVAIHSTETGKLVWTNQRELDPKSDPTKRTAQINKTVDKLLAKYPPRRR